MIIMDVMLRWASPSPDAPSPPQDVIDGEYFQYWPAMCGDNGPRF